MPQTHRRRPWSHADAIDLRLDPTEHVDLLRVPPTRRLPLKLRRLMRRRAGHLDASLRGDERS
jgi:hypothetical protein